MESLINELNRITEPNFREKMLSKGLARSLIWKDGVLSKGAPLFSENLSSDLINYALGLIHICLTLYESQNTNPKVKIPKKKIREGFKIAAEAIESVVKNNNPDSKERGFLIIIAALSYQLARFSARAFCLLEVNLSKINLSDSERIIAFLLKKQLNHNDHFIFKWITDPNHTDNKTASLLKEENDFLPEDALNFALTKNFLKAIADFDYLLKTGNEELLSSVNNKLDFGKKVASEYNLIIHWWNYRLTKFLVNDLWSRSLHKRLAISEDSDWNSLRELFIAFQTSKKFSQIEVWPSQLEASKRSYDSDDDLVVTLPTSAGKTRIAEFCILRALSKGQRVVYVTPLRALSAQVEATLENTFRPLGYSISSLYGVSGGVSVNDVDTLGNCNIVVSTPEKLDFALRNNSSLLDDVGLVIFDEAHMIGPNEREVRYEILIQRLLKRSDSNERRIVCLSAILPQGEELDDYVDWIRKDIEGSHIQSDWRPTRQRFGEVLWKTNSAELNIHVDDTETTWIKNFIIQKKSEKTKRKKPFPDNDNELTIALAWRMVDDGNQVLIYCPQRRRVEKLASEICEMHSRGFIDSTVDINNSLLKDTLAIGKEWLGEEHPVMKVLRLGVVIHHAKLPKAYLNIVEKLIQEKVCQIIIASPTLSQGLNISASVLIFHGIQKFKEEIISPEEFTNVVGRAGRAFVDIEGLILLPVFEPDTYQGKNKLASWKSLRKQVFERKLKSGLLQVTINIIKKIGKSTKSKDINEVIHQLINNNSIWEIDFGENEQEKKDWNSEINRLDAAILSLITEFEANPNQLSNILDHFLLGSLWQRQLLKYNEEGQKILKLILESRAGWIWKNSTPSQRRGYYSTCLSFKSGQDIDKKADILEQRLVSAEVNLILGSELEDLTEAIIQFADIIFEIDPFIPEELPADWKALLSLWIAGKNLSQIIESSSTDSPKIVTFIQDGLIYKLVWGLEVIRIRWKVRDKKENEDISYGDLTLGNVAQIVATGTPNISASLLIQSGLPSREAAIQAVDQLDATFDNFKEMWHWLFSKEVHEVSQKEGWPTKDSSQIWKDYTKKHYAYEYQRWKKQEETLSVEWLNRKNVKIGQSLRILPNTETGTWLVYSTDYELLGNMDEALFYDFNIGIINAYVESDKNILLSYIGPSIQE